MPVKRNLKNKAINVVILSLIFVTEIFGQHILTSDNIAVPWEVYKLVLIPDSIKVTTGDSGANADWDFSNYTFATDSIIAEHLLPSGTGFGGSFPNSDHAEKTSDGALKYYSLSSSEYVLDGLVNDTSIIIPYSDPQIIYKFPFGFGSKNEDDFKGVIESQGTKTYRTGNAVIKGDSYGTLKFSADTFDNALRVFQKIIFQDSSNVFGIPYVVKYDFEAHLWYDGAYKYPVFTIGKYIIDLGGFGKDTTNVAYKLEVAQTNTGIISTNRKNPIQIIYKPDFLEIKMDVLNPGKGKIEIVDLTGRIIYFDTFSFLSGENSVLLPRTFSGIGLIRFTTDEFVVSRKLY